MASERRLTEWFDLAGDLLRQPRPELPRAEIAQQLGRTFPVHTVSWDWRESPGSSGFQTWPEIDFDPVAHLPLCHQDEILTRHPIVRWFLVTQDPRPQSTDRVPVRLAPRRDRQLVADYLKPVGVEKQLSIPYLLHGNSYGTFVLNRSEDDYGDDDLDLAGHLQRLIRGLYLRTAPVARAQGRAGTSCAAATALSLTATELAVLTLLCGGHTAYGIGLRLDMAPRTVSKHLEHTYRKLGVHDRLAAVTAAREAGAVSVPGTNKTPSPGPGSRAWSTTLDVESG